MRAYKLALLAGCADALVRGSFDPLGLAARDAGTITNLSQNTPMVYNIQDIFIITNYSIINYIS